MNEINKIHQHLKVLYPTQDVHKIFKNIQDRIVEFQDNHPILKEMSPIEERLSEQDAILITYADQFQGSEKAPLAVLLEFLQNFVGRAFNGLHLLPFYPYSSDDGFSVIDYRNVSPEFGNWEHITRLGKEYKLMFDAVINHISKKSSWFEKFLKGNSKYEAYFIEVPEDTDLTKVVRPRALPLLTKFETNHGTRSVWTTFSDDQIDLNYSNPQVLFEMIDLLLYYVDRGAKIIRLDAVAYLWKELGTTCIHLPQTHEVVKLFRTVLNAVAPNVLLITETNVPHEENLSYFGNGYDEAQLVYQFSLAPLVLHTFRTGDAHILTNWANSLETPSNQTTFFNFIASHDGIGVRPAEGLLSPEEIGALVRQTETHGGFVSYKQNSDGSKSVYELNITLYDFLNDPSHPNPTLDAARFLASQAIILTLAGVPGIYVHSLFGARNCLPCVNETGRPRSINREKFDVKSLHASLQQKETHTSQVFYGYIHMLNQRRQQKYFDPNVPQRIISLNPAAFILWRGEESDPNGVLCITNVTSRDISLFIPIGPENIPFHIQWQDLITGKIFKTSNQNISLNLNAYQYMWLVPNES